MKTIMLKVEAPHDGLDDIDRAVIVSTIQAALQLDPAFNSMCATFLAPYEVRISWEGDGSKDSVAVHTPRMEDL